jgi:outer membrane lipase/esterase
MFARSMLVVAAALLTLNAATVDAKPTTTVPIKRVVVLGDSLSDQGNLLFATEILNGPGVPPAPDPTRYDAGRFANGPNYVDRLAAKLGVTVLPSELGGTNYAFGGSRTNYNRGEFRPGVLPPLPNGVYPIGAFPWSLDLQRAEFLAQAGPRKADPTTLYIVFHGSNDLADAFIAAVALGQDPMPRLQTAVQGVVNTVLAFKSAGARTILVPLMPNLGVVPSITALGPQAAGFASALSVAFNQALTQALAPIEGPNIILFDTFGFLTQVVLQPGLYGFTNSTEPCYTGFVAPNPAATVCAQPDEYVFWDVEHPTTRLHAVLAEALFTTVLRCSNQGKAPFARCAVNAH